MLERLNPLATALLLGALFPGTAAAAPTLERGSFTFDGRTLNYFCGGKGSPTLILEAPSGVSNEAAYANILADLAASHRFCAYGGSEPVRSRGRARATIGPAAGRDHARAP